LGAVAVAIVRRKEREVRDAFRSAGATNPQSAMSISDIGVDENLAFHRLKRNAVIRETGPSLFYFDEDVWQAFCAMRRRMLILLTVTVVLVGLVLFYGVVTL
jgi:hypothetical protein